MASKKTEGAQEARTTAQAKTACGTYKSRKEALQEAVEAKKAGVDVSLAIENGGYTLLASRGLAKARTGRAKQSARAKEAGITEP